MYVVLKKGNYVLFPIETLEKAKDVAISRASDDGYEYAIFELVANVIPKRREVLLEEVK